MLLNNFVEVLDKIEKDIYYLNWNKGYIFNNNFYEEYLIG